MTSCTDVIQKPRHSLAYKRVGPRVPGPPRDRDRHRGTPVCEDGGLLHCRAREAVRTDRRVEHRRFARP